MQLTETERKWNRIDDGVLPYVLAAMRAVWLWLGMRWLTHLLAPPRAEPIPFGVVFGLLALATLITQFAVFRLSAARGAWLVLLGGLIATGVTLYITFGATMFRDVGALLVSLLFAAWCWRWGILAGREPLLYDTYARNFLYGVIALALIVFGALTTHFLTVGELIFPVLGFFALGLGALAVASLRDAQRYERSESGQSFAFNRYWLGTVGLVVAALLMVGLVLGGLFAPEWAAQALSAIGLLWRLITAVLLVIVYVFVLIVVGVLDFLGRFVHFTPGEGPSLPPQEPLRLEDLLKNQPASAAGIPPELYLLAQVAAGALLVLALALLFARAFRRFRKYREEDTDETHESVFSMDLLKTQLARFFRRDRSPDTAGEPFAFLQGDEPRAQIRRIYQELLTWAAVRGVTRTPGQTPGEFERALVERLGLERAPLALITSAYLDARYAAVSPTPESAQRTARAWQELSLSGSRNEPPARSGIMK